MPGTDRVLAPPPAFALPRLDGVLPGVRADESDPITVRITYLDAPDLRLARAGVVLKYQSDDGFLVRVPDPAKGSDVIERRAEGEAAAPPAEILDLVRSRLRTADAAPVARLRTLRRTVALRRLDGQPLGTVTDDEVSVLDGRRVAGRFREVHIETAADAPDQLLTAIAERLRTAGAGAPDPTPQLVRVLGTRALDPPDFEPVTGLSPDSAAGEVVRAAIVAAAGRLVTFDPVVRVGEDPEGVHQARVATRRLRSDLRTFRSLLEPEWNNSLRDELRWIAGMLGAVRDADVLVARLTENARSLATADRDHADVLLKRLADARVDARTMLLDALRSPRYLALLDRLVDAARAPHLAYPEANESAATALPPVVAGPWRHLQAAVESLGDAPADEQLHNVRIRAKRARYAAEAVAPTLGKPARRYAKAVAEVQEVLGQHQDAVVAEHWLRDAAEHADASELFAAGQLAAVERAAAAEARAEFPKAWKDASAKRLRDWF
jgi:CHAD domain-containing protein